LVSCLLIFLFIYHYYYQLERFALSYAIYKQNFE
jgi:hypothetical protein